MCNGIGIIIIIFIAAEYYSSFDEVFGSGVLVEKPKIPERKWKVKKEDGKIDWGKKVGNAFGIASYLSYSMPATYNYLFLLSSIWGVSYDIMGTTNVSKYTRTFL